MATHSIILALKISMDRGALWATVHGVAKRHTRLGDFTFTFTQELWCWGTCFTYFRIPYKAGKENTLGFPGGSGSKEFACNAKDLGLIPGLGRSLGGGRGSLL